MSDEEKTKPDELKKRSPLVSANRLWVGIAVAVVLVGMVILSHLGRDSFDFIGGLTDGRAIVSTLLSIIIVMAIIEMRRAIGFDLIPHSMSWIVWAYAIGFGPSYFFFGYTGIVFMSLFVFAVSAFNAIMINRADVIMHVAFLLVYPGLLMSSLLYLNKCAATHTIDPSNPVYNYVIRDIWEMVGGSRTTYLLPFNSLGLAFVFGVSCFTDVFAMLFGKAFGKRKLCPLVSPKKTVEGALGGLFGGVFGAVVVYLIYEVLGSQFEFFRLLFGYGLWLQEMSSGGIIAIYLIIGFIGSAMTQIGDLLASITKRHFGIKDYSHVLGEHGGIMDRFDGIMLNASFVALVYMFII